MDVLVVRFLLLLSSCTVVRLDVPEPPVCEDYDVLTSHEDADDKLQSACPPTEDCELEFVKYKIKKNPILENLKWKFDEASTCRLCLPTCCSNLTIVTRIRKNACDEYLSFYNFQKQSKNIWSHYDREELTYIVSKDLVKDVLNLHLPREKGMRLCRYIVYQNKYLTVMCGVLSIPRSNAKAARCARGETSTGKECAKSQRIGL